MGGVERAASSSAASPSRRTVSLSIASSLNRSQERHKMMSGPSNRVLGYCPDSKCLQPPG